MPKQLLSEEDASLYASFGPELGLEIAKIPTKIRDLEPDDLENQVKPSFQHYQTKIAFWQEYYESRVSNRKLSINKVIMRARVSPYFFRRLTKDSKALWWLMQPVSDYNTQLEALLYKALKKEDSILDLPDVSEEGEVNMKLLELKTKMIKEIKDRVIGPVATRTEIKKHSMITGDMRNITPNRGDSVDAAIQMLEEELYGKKEELGPGRAGDRREKEVHPVSELEEEYAGGLDADEGAGIEDDVQDALPPDEEGLGDPGDGAEAED